MVAASPVNYRSVLWFSLLLLAVVGVEFFAIQRPDFALRPMLPAAVSFDLVVLLPVSFYLLVVRPYRLPVGTLGAAFAAAVAACTPLNDAPPAAPGLVNSARLLLTPPNLLLTLHAPHRAAGPYGLPQTVGQLALYLDNPPEFQAALRAAAASASGNNS